jgi:hypothetical protein
MVVRVDSFTPDLNYGFEQDFSASYYLIIFSFLAFLGERGKSFFV